MTKKFVGHSFDSDKAWIAELEQMQEQTKQLKSLLPTEIKKELRLFSKKLEVFQKFKLEIEKKDEELKSYFVEKMKDNGIPLIEFAGVKIKFVEEFSRTSVDTKKLKEMHPDVYMELNKTSKVKASVRISLKNEAKDD